MLAYVYMVLGLALAGGAITAMMKFKFGANVNGVLEDAGRMPRLTDGLTPERIIFGGALILMWLIVALSTLWLGPFVFNRGRRLKARTAQSIMKNDPRPPILYLRPFDSDPFKITILPNFFSEEEQICEPFSELGPTIAIAAPGEELAPSGAARLELRDSWQDGVAKLLRSSQRILVRADSTSGLLWEIRTIISMNEPQKFLLFALGPTIVYARFLQDAEGEFPKGLPALSSMLEGDAAYVTACIRFNESWEHTVIRLGHVRFRMIARLRGAIEQSPLCGPNGPIPPLSLRRRVRRLVGLTASLAIMFFSGSYVCTGLAVVLAPPTEFLSLFFTKSRTQAFLDVFPADLRQPIQSELSKDADVTAWVNSSEPSDWFRLSDVASPGIGKLSGRDRIIAVRVLHKILKSLEPQVCNKTLRSLSNDVTGRAAFFDLVIEQSRAGSESERARLVVAAIAARKYGFIQPGPDDTALLKQVFSGLPPKEKAAFLAMLKITSSYGTADCETMISFLNVALTAQPIIQDQLVAIYFNYFPPFSKWR